MSRLAAVWPVAGQVSSAALSAVATALIYYLFEAEVASQYFGVAAMVTIMATVGAFGQQRILPRDVAISKRAHNPVRGQIAARLRLVALVAICAAALGVVIEYGLSRASLGALVGVALWISVDSLRRILADTHFGLHHELRAVATGDALRWVLNLVGIITYVTIFAGSGLGGLILVAVLAVIVTGVVSGFSLARTIDAGPESSDNWRAHRVTGAEVRSGVTNMAATVAASLTPQASIVTATLVLSASESATFTFAMRIAVGLTLVQSGLAKYVLPRAVVLADTNLEPIERADTIRLVQRASRLATFAALALLIAAVGIFLVLNSESKLVGTITILGVASLLNVAAGPAGAVLVANHHEGIVLVSNVAFGSLALLAPFAYFANASYWLVVAIVGFSIALHHGVLAGAARELFAAKFGLWGFPVGLVRFSLRRS